MPRRVPLALIAVFGLLVASAPAAASPIVVLNASFENPVTPNYTGVINDWVSSGETGVFDPAGTAACCGGLAYYFNQALPDGKQTAFSNSGAIHQTLAAVLTAGQTYTLTVAVGDRIGEFAVPSHAIQLRAGGNILASNAGAPLDGFFDDVIVSYTATAGSLGIGSALEIWLVNNLAVPAPSQQINYDNVRLDGVAASGTDATPVPEPATMVLCATGLVAGCWRRRRRANR